VLVVWIVTLRAGPGGNKKPANLYKRLAGPRLEVVLAFLSGCQGEAADETQEFFGMGGKRAGGSRGIKGTAGA
jgi:hypothetical protein